jgi:protein-S-isoprenylcysteine O-methyltransferase Ste14
VISLKPQQALITTGPYSYSRNPLYLGGNVFIFFGAALVLGSPAALIITALHLPLVNVCIRREERQLGTQFGEAWLHYRNHGAGFDLELSAVRDEFGHSAPAIARGRSEANRRH